jgi:hypothetical protein
VEVEELLTKHEMGKFPPLGTQALVISSRAKFSQLENCFSKWLNNFYLFIYLFMVFFSFRFLFFGE